MSAGAAGPHGESMTKAAVAALLLLALVAFGAAKAVTVYLDSRAEIFELQQAIAASWQSADEVIQQRAELAPELIRAIQPFATRERKEIQRLRQACATLERSFLVPNRIAANDEISLALLDLLAVAEDYPELRSRPQYKRLQDELAAIENQVAAQRRRYNQQVQDYNTRLQLFPNNFVAAMEGFEREEAYFRTNEKSRQAPPVVNFTGTTEETETSVEPAP